MFTEVCDILEIYCDLPEKHVLGTGKDGVLVTEDVFKLLPCLEVGIRVLDNYNGSKYKLYKIIDGVTFFIYSDSKIIM